MKTNELKNGINNGISRRIRGKKNHERRIQKRTIIFLDHYNNSFSIDSYNRFFRMVFMEYIEKNNKKQSNKLVENRIMLLMLIIICAITEIYLISIIIISIFEKRYFYKDGNKKGTNLKGRALRTAIKHELVHARISNKFGFTDWKIIYKKAGLACKINIEYDVLNWKLLFNVLKMCTFHFIFDIARCIVWVSVIGICEYVQEYISDIKRIIGKFIINKQDL